ncbi:MAG: hypothetical protein Q4E75_03420 [bacterium]|nr:hypothetical protein [bacterium]
MEIKKEAFSSLMEYYKVLPLETKRKEVISEIEEIISNYSKVCISLGITPNILLNKEMLNTNKNNLNESDFLNSLYAYINALQEISSEVLENTYNILGDVIDAKSNRD